MYLQFRQPPKPIDPRMDPSAVAASSKSIEAFLKNKEGLRRKEYDAQAAMPTDVPIPMAPPEMPPYKELTPMEKWKQRNMAMLQSGNPVLQEQALKEQGTYATKMAESTFSDKRPNSFREFLQAAEDPEYLAFLQSMKAAGATNIKMGEEKFLTSAEADKMEMLGDDGWGPLPTGLKYADVRDPSKFRYKDNLASDSAGKYAMLDTALDQYEIIENLMFSEDGSVNQDVLKGVTGIDSALAIPGIGKFIGMAAKKYFNEDSPLVQQSLETGMQAITRTETGAAMAEQEIANVKARFMPTYGDSDTLVNQKLSAYKQFMDTAINLIRTKQGKGKNPDELTKGQILDLVEESFDNVDGGEPELPPGLTWE